MSINILLVDNFFCRTGKIYIQAQDTPKSKDLSLPAVKDRGITDEMYDSFLKEYKEKQAELLDQMKDHSEADEQFYITANITLNIAKRAKEIFMSSEVEEKRQFLGFLLQNCILNEKKLEFSMRSPFNLLLNNSDNLTMRRR